MTDEDTAGELLVAAEFPESDSLRYEDFNADLEAVVAYVALAAWIGDELEGSRRAAAPSLRAIGRTRLTSVRYGSPFAATILTGLLTREGLRVLGELGRALAEIFRVPGDLAEDFSSARLNRANARWIDEQTADQRATRLRREMEASIAAVEAAIARGRFTPQERDVLERLILAARTNPEKQSKYIRAILRVVNKSARFTD